MAYITFEEYQELGGSLVESSFNVFEKKAERKLDYFTLDRIKALTVISDEIKEVMVDFIDKLSNKPLNGNITSYSNGIESISFAGNQIVALDKELYQIAVEILPIELISTYVSEV